MLKKLIVAGLVAAFYLNGGGDAQAQKKTGKTTGAIKSSKATANGKNTIIEVLAPGEEKARSYRVMYDPQVKGPIPKILALVREAKVGDTVQFSWVDTGEGLAITEFQVLKKGNAPAKDGDKKGDK